MVPQAIQEIRVALDPDTPILPFKSPQGLEDWWSRVWEEKPVPLAMFRCNGVALRVKASFTLPGGYGVARIEGDGTQLRVAIACSKHPTAALLQALDELYRNALSNPS